MKSFARFLHVTFGRGISDAGSSTAATEAWASSPTWFFEDLFVSPVAFRAFNSSLGDSSHECRRVQWRATLGEGMEFDEDSVGPSPLANLDDGNVLNSWSLKDLDSAAAKMGSSGGAFVEGHIPAILVCHAVILICMLI